MRLDELKIIANTHGFNVQFIEKDFLLTYLLYLIKDVKGIYFKGGTALNKIILNHQRISEDLDFTLDRDLNDVEKDIRSKLNGTIFKSITHDKRVDRFVRLIAHYKLFHEEGTIFIDLNERGNVMLKPKKMAVQHFYDPIIPAFEVSCLHPNEMVAEKVMATCERYKPRDYLDLYYIINSKVPISVSLIRKKFRQNGETFKIASMFKNTNRIFSEWENDLAMITRELPPFKDVIETIKRFFKYRK